MSRQEKRLPRGKRSRDEPSVSSRGPPIPGTTPINYTAAPSNLYGEPQFSPTAGFQGSGRLSGSASFDITSQIPSGKVAIPPLKARQASESSPKPKKGRTAHACDTCRRAKAGCSGGQPCSRCRNSKVACIYGDGKRDRDRKKLTQLSKDTSILSQVNTDMVDALRRIRIDMSLSPAEIRAQIGDVLAMVPATLSPATRETSSQPSKGTSEMGEQDSSDDDDDGDDDADVGSNNSIDVTGMDVDQDNDRATGYMGKSSSVAWAKRTADEVQQADSQTDSSTGFTLTSYHTEELDFEEIDTSNIDPFGWPTPPVAESLVKIYFKHIHDALPLVNKAEFISKFVVFDGNTRRASTESTDWFGVSNMIFAISSVYLHLTKRLTASNPYDHFVYLARAKKLCLNEDILYQDRGISNTCALGLMCLYFMSTGNLNRAWTFSGLALRQAFSQGLHSRNVSKSLVDFEKEYRVRLWWSLFSLECSLNELTGRPSGISDRDISTPLPINMDEESMDRQTSLYDALEDAQRLAASRRGSYDHEGRSATYQYGSGGSQPLAYTFPILSLPVTKSTYFIYRVQLNILSHKIVTQLYCASIIRDKWSEVQSVMQQIDKRLLAWKSSLPIAFDIDFDAYSRPDWNDSHTLERLGLAMLFNSSRMILFRPCLCRFEDRKARNRSSRSNDADQTSIENCISSARNIIALVSLSIKNTNSHTPSLSATFQAVPPFWLTLHYLCEALAVLMLEMAFQAPHIGVNEAVEILEDSKKGVRWLIDMSAQSIPARKAWEIFDGLIRLVAPKIRWSVFDLPTEAPIPSGYNWRRFNPHNQPQYSNSASWLQQQTVSNPYLQGQNIVPIPPQPSYLPYPPSYGELQFASNPLDPTTAIQRFSTIGGVHGHHDESWTGLFATTSSPQVPVMMADTAINEMGIGIGGGIGMEIGMGLDEGSGGGTTGTTTGYEQSYPDPQSYGNYPSGYGQGGFGGG